jgi:uncharacterized repeat protein (TIGR01451 family)
METCNTATDVDATPDYGKARTDPNVTLQWVGPPSTKRGEVATYHMVAKNLGALQVEHVVVQSTMPAGVQLVASNPKPIPEAGGLRWELGMLLPHQERQIELQLLPQGKSDFRCDATISFASRCSTRIAVRDPKLSLKITSPGQAFMGDPVVLALTVRNIGDGTADRIKARVTLPTGLENRAGTNLELDLGSLAPNEVRTVQVPCTAEAGGQQRIEALVWADSNISAQDSVALNVMAPVLNVVVAGRDLLYIDRKSTFAIKVTNTSAAPAINVSISDLLPSGLKFVAASDQGQYDSSPGTVSWYIGDLGAGDSKEVRLELQASEMGDHEQRAQATGTHGTFTEGRLTTHIEGVSMLVMEARALDNPVEVAAETGYELHVANMGNRTEAQLIFACTLPENVELRNIVGPGGSKYTVNGRDIIFQPIAKLAPRAEMTFRVNVRGVTPGDSRFRASLKADGLANPIVRELATKVY